MFCAYVHEMDTPKALQIRQHLTRDVLIWSKSARCTPWQPRRLMTIRAGCRMLSTYTGDEHASSHEKTIDKISSMMLYVLCAGARGINTPQALHT